MEPMSVIWLVAFIVFAIAEAATVQLVSIWFAAGALAAFIVSLLNAPLWLQLVIFLVVVIVALILTRPLIKKHLNAQVKPTNADRVIGMACRVTEDIDNIAATGAVSVQGKVWTARSKTGQPFKTGELVRAVAIEGVKLIVIPIEENKQ